MTFKFKIGEPVRWAGDKFGMPQILAENAVNFDRDARKAYRALLEDDTFGIVLSYTQIRYEWSTPHEDTIIWYEVYWGSKGTTMCAEAHLERI